ncbi:MAG: hypothetical protein B7Z60_01740 [Ferrovum sp. 37-45-19]|uniref:HesA/MoeB/ThiF family protein n=1 Tax=Ferrovum sp. JA12 TaxID=1356299 RepID=UPI000702E067|nr:HesA/MoeB/ThiF family protein [Ferrovum sp. JA12]KRH79884.1 molybdopterin-synthase adenylyltransferase [Ferrovum sp. JA12]OYV95283.1 MAG: hypothetical protein B7Z60_01740 [Ferrovum sp. 37-45-19]OZB33698.1 MAG: hypothetical protein B7X47_02925 [Ferrovum sp. 34-44-207]HQT80789.1 HesA/MoeB/ThiF family protein [Ferrovaceae bacterium]
MNEVLGDEDLLRYSRHILLNEVDVEGVKRIRNSKILIVGVGGLGSIAALYLGASGVGEISLVDDDKVDLTNLQRQVAFSTQDIQENKAIACQQAIQRINPAVIVKVYAERFTASLGAMVLPSVDVVLDCSDNFTTRHLVNRLCVQYKIPLVCGAAIRFDGQLTVFDARDGENPCYECLFPDNNHSQDEACATMGVLSPLVGMIGSAQAIETLKLLAGVGQSLVGRLVLFNALNCDTQTMHYRQDKNCKVCVKST